MNDYRETMTAGGLPADTLHTVSGRVVVPALASAVTGLAWSALVLAIALPVAYAYDRPVWGWYLSAVAWAGMFLRDWRHNQGKIDNHWGDVVALAEIALKHNFDDDPRIGNGMVTEKPEQKLRVDVNTQDESGITQTDIVRTAKRPALYVAREVTDGKNFSAALIKPGYLTRDEWEALRDEYLERGIIRKRDENNELAGYELTKPGKAYFRHLTLQFPQEKGE